MAVHCHGDSDPQHLLLIFQWTRVRITNAHAFETAIHLQVAKNTETKVTSRNVTMFHNCSDHGCTMTFDVKAEVGLWKMGKDRHYIIDNVRFEYG